MISVTFHSHSFIEGKESFLSVDWTGHVFAVNPAVTSHMELLKTGSLLGDHDLRDELQTSSTYSQNTENPAGFAPHLVPGSAFVFCVIRDAADLSPGSSASLRRLHANFIHCKFMTLIHGASPFGAGTWVVRGFLFNRRCKHTLKIRTSGCTFIFW